MFSIKSNAQIVKAEIRATGLTCSMCSNAINKQLKALPEVINVETDLNTNTFTVTLKEGNELSPKTFKEKVEKAGFFIGSLVVTAKSNTITQSSYIMVNDNECTNIFKIFLKLFLKYIFLGAVKKCMPKVKVAIFSWQIIHVSIA